MPLSGALVFLYESTVVAALSFLAGRSSEVGREETVLFDVTSDVFWSHESLIIAGRLLLDDS